MTAETEKSAFITALAWVGIVFAGLSAFMTAVQNIMLQFLLPRSQVEELISESNRSLPLPETARFMVNHFDLVFLAAFVVSVSVLIVSIGLLKRKNWARITFIALLALGIVWNLGGLVFQQTMLQELPAPANVPEAFQLQMEKMMTVMSIASVIFALIFSALFAWMIWKLLSAQVVNEFKNGQHFVSGEHQI